MKKTQTSQGHDIRQFLKAGNSISALEALGIFRCFRLAARIKQLRDEGMRIITTMRADTTGKRYARYHLETPNAHR